MANTPFKIADTATLQIETLPQPEKTALRRFFESSRADRESKAVPGGNLAAQLGTRRVLWRRDANGRPVILSVLDQSYANRA